MTAQINDTTKMSVIANNST